MRFSNKRSGSSRKAPAPADTPSPVTETTEAVPSPSTAPKDASRAPADTPKRASQSNVAPVAETSASSRKEPAKAESGSDQIFSPAGSDPADIPDELIASRAYELWQRRGCPMGHESAQDWHAARAKLEQERLGWAAPEPDDRNRI